MQAQYKRGNAEAIAQGFSSLDERERHSMDEFERLQENHEKWMAEQAALAGKTFEEFSEEYWAPQEFRPNTGPSCDCDGE